MSLTETRAMPRPPGGRGLVWAQNRKEAGLSEVKRARRRAEDRPRVEGKTTEATVRTFTLSDLESCCFFQ